MSIDSYIKKIDNFSKNVKSTDKEFVKLGGVLHSQIIKRTHSGKDANLKKFKEYSKNYYDYKKDSGRPVANVNLSFYGQMMNGISKKKITKGVRLFFNNADALKKMISNHYGEGRKPARPFWGWDKMQIKFINKAIIHILRRGNLWST